MNEMTSTTAEEGAISPGIPSVESIRTLAVLCQQAGVHTLEAEDGQWSVRLQLDLNSVNGAMPSMPAAHMEMIADGPTVLYSQWVGVFHRSADGETEPYVRDGQQIDDGDMLGVIVALQLQHELRADRRGALARFLVEDGTAVEYGQPLVEIL